MDDLAAPPVVLFIFNRPALTARAFEAVRQAAPQRLYVFADGPRVGVPDDGARTAAARAATADVDWPCEVHRDYAAHNLGIKTRVESALRRVFTDVEAAILFEDDCLPHPTFFRFCRELLGHYRDDPRVMNISGARTTPRFSGKTETTGPSYRFSRYPTLSAWATWRRTWSGYDGRMAAWPALHGSWLEARLPDRDAVTYWTYIFDKNRDSADRGDWDTAWLFSTWTRNGLSIVPAVNLVSNLGHQADATHTKNPTNILSALPTFEMTFPLYHPDTVSPCAEEERLAESVVFSGNLTRLMATLRQRVRQAGRG